MNYKEFLTNKTKAAIKSGFTPETLNGNLFPFQRHIVTKAVEAGKYAIFADCGMGKTIMQLAWADAVLQKVTGKILILAPLAVVGQTIQEATKFGIEVSRLDGNAEIHIANYEQLKNIDTSIYIGIILDESSILKNFQGKFRTLIIKTFKSTPYKLACTATPAPNDPMELGNHSEFLDVMRSDEMVAMYFIRDSGKAGEWRLKGHGIKNFYTWVSTWATMIAKPSDIGFSDSGYVLPKLEIINHETISPKKENWLLFNDVAVSATGFNGALRDTAEQRMAKAAEIANATVGPVIVWIKHNDEGKALLKLIPDAIEVKGSDKHAVKEKNLLGFGRGEFRVLITKSKIASFGLNYQNCACQIVASLDFSFEGLYQSMRRSWRFGQKNDVNIHVITTDNMKNVRTSIESKQKAFRVMQLEMARAVSSIQTKKTEMKTKDIKEANFKMMLGDSIKRIKEIESESIDFSFFSPPFSSLFTYSDNPEDLSNCTDHDTFYQHFKFLIPELLRIVKKGRLVSLHISQLTTGKGRDGFLSIIDFRGELIRLFQKCGFYFHAEVAIRKSPQLTAVRTKNMQLLHGTTKRDSCINRPGLADYIITFRKPGDNAEPVNHEKNGIPFELWCDIAEPIWMDVQEGDVLKNYRKGRNRDDERHITPTQLKPIHNLMIMYTNPNDTVFSPFAGVGSEGYQAVIMDRKFIGIELKESYFDQAVKNLRTASQLSNQTSLF